LKGQQSAYIERQLAAFAQAMRQNDIDERMRTIASQLTPLEMHSLAEFYAAGVGANSAGAKYIFSQRAALSSIWSQHQLPLFHKY
jgi:cytochrome c553